MENVIVTGCLAGRDNNIREETSAFWKSPGLPPLEESSVGAVQH